MDDKLFTDLLDSAREIACIEKDEQSLNPDRVTIFEENDVKR